MAKFILLYNGPATPMEEMTEEQGKKTKEGWNTWMQKVGAAVTDIGAPMANGTVVVDDGSTGTATELSGYTIIQADNMEEAVKLVDGHPFLSDGSGKFSVEIFELMPVPAM